MMPLDEKQTRKCRPQIKIVSDVLIIHLSIILNRVNGRAGHCHNNERRLSHVQANEEISTLLYALGHYFSDEGLTN